MKAGPCRPPYHLVPESYLEGARESGKMLAKLHAQLDAVPPARAAAGR
jgi:trans-o-hydroxybenzylidenepyruvate hydratase-aldolase